jgi:hypothetical protein
LYSVTEFGLELKSLKIYHVDVTVLGKTNDTDKLLKTGSVRKDKRNLRYYNGLWFSKAKPDPTKPVP